MFITRYTATKAATAMRMRTEKNVAIGWLRNMPTLKFS
ncbi:unannotated protein [freshwater metagenome]|uniref:Unannotated protein n=1 Tax=freshwater metagenome TaxID=449393 RepID=A0A6J7ECT9_9ZZZZ